MSGREAAFFDRLEHIVLAFTSASCGAAARSRMSDFLPYQLSLCVRGKADARCSDWAVFCRSSLKLLAVALSNGSSAEASRTKPPRLGRGAPQSTEPAIGAARAIARTRCPGSRIAPTASSHARGVHAMATLIRPVVEFLEKPRDHWIARHERVRCIGFFVELIIERAADHVQDGLLG
jgi:hypothetical protein